MVGGLQKKLKAVPTGSLALDFELGTGGWPLGKLIGVFGPRDIGKSSMIGLHGVANAQRMGLTCGWIAYEAFDEEWAVKNGVVIEELFVAYPESGEQAWGMLHQMLKSGEIDFIVLDSVGALRGKSEIDDDGKPRMGGMAMLNSWGVSVAAPLADRNNCAVILLNQVRVSMNTGGGGGVLYEQPGGKALEHMEWIIVQLKHNKEKHTIRQNGTDVMIGRQVVADIRRNKSTQGTGHKAIFDYFFSEADGHTLGVDMLSDVTATAIRTGVIKKGGSFYTLPNGKKFQGLKKVGDYLEKNPQVVLEIREGVLQAMLERNTRTVIHEETEEESDE